MASSDTAYKLLFSQPRMVEDTLRGYVAPDWCEALDFSTLAQRNAEYIGTDLHHRIGDMLWRIEFREGSPLGGPLLANGERPYLLVLFEFQSAVDPDMAWRMHEYVYLLQRHQRGNGTLIGLETGAAEALPGLLWEAFERYAGEEEKGLREGYHARVRDAGALRGGEGLPPLAEMERELEARRGGRQMPGLMEARIMEWEARVLERGREQALAELEQALEAGREGGEALTLMDARAMEWEARVLERGREQGIAQGRAEERALLRRQAERRFGAETAGQVSELLADVEDAEDLLEAGDWILECRTGGELLERLRHAHGK